VDCDRIPWPGGRGRGPHHVPGCLLRDKHLYLITMVHSSKIYTIPFAIACTLLVIAYLAPKSFFVEEQSSSKFYINYYCVNESFPALDGVDLVEYFSLSYGSSAVYGTSDYTSIYQGFKFYFTTETNKKTFDSNPSSYLPRWGGFCSYGIAQEDWWSPDLLGPATDLDVWEIVNGNLYFFRGYGARDLFNKSLDDNIKLGNERWESWFGDDDFPFNTKCFMIGDTEIIV